MERGQQRKKGKAPSFIPEDMANRKRSGLSFNLWKDLFALGDWGKVFSVLQT